MRLRDWQHFKALRALQARNDTIPDDDTLLETVRLLERWDVKLKSVVRKPK